MKKAVRKKVILITALLLLIIGLAVLSAYLKSLADYKEAVRTTIFHEAAISELSDGVYIGEYDVNFIYAKVEVTIQAGEIKEISLIEHKNDRGKSAEAVIDKIIDEQKIDVDAVSGATNSSIVIKKAVDNALEKAVEKKAGSTI